MGCLVLWEPRETLGNGPAEAIIIGSVKDGRKGNRSETEKNGWLLSPSASSWKEAGF